MADGKIQLEIVTPSRRVLSVAVDEVRAPGAQGGFGVRPGHTPFLSMLAAGELVAVSGGRADRYAVGEGFVQVAEDKVLVLAETADRAEDIDLDSARREVEEEQKKLTGMTPGEDYDQQRARVERAAAKVVVASRR